MVGNLLLFANGTIIQHLQNILLGLCGMDKLLVVAGEGDSLTPDEAISFLNIQRNFDFSYCHKYISNAHIALVALGLVFRLLAFLLLYFARKGL